MPVSRTEVTVHVNRGATDTLETDTTAFETRDSFSLVLRGHETPAHVHCRLGSDRDDGDFSRVTSIAGPNYYVEPDDTITVPVTVDATDVDEPLEGRLEVLTGYGSESVTIDVTIKPKPASVEIDESLAKPASTADSSERTILGRAVDRMRAATPTMGTLAVLALGALAIAIATSTAATIGGPVAMIGLVIVVVGVAVALFLLLW